MADIKSVLKNIETRFGKEAIAGKQTGVKFLSTGSIGLDDALGGGWAKGRVVEIHGWESSGKSTLALHAAAECQKEGKIVAYIDAEHALDAKYANNLGVNTSEKCGLWYLSQPNNGEEALEIGREFAACKDVGLVIFDSNTSMIPKAIIAGEAGDSKMGLQARMFSSMLPTFIAPIKKSDCVVLVIGQLREKIGVMFGNPETTTGGNALKFYTSQRVRVSKSSGGNVKDGDQVIANGTKCKVIKNKVAPPLKTCEFAIEFGVGIDKVSELIDYAVEFDVIKRSGAWYSYGETRLGQGQVKTKALMLDNPELVDEVREKVFNKLKGI